MPDGSFSTPAQTGNLIATLAQLEAALNRDERGGALELVAKAKEISSSLTQQVARHVSDGQDGMNAADSLCSVTALALRQMDCDQDGDCADVMENHLWPTAEGSARCVGSAQRDHHSSDRSAIMSANIAETSEDEAREAAWNKDWAQDIRSFLASVKPLDGCCFCSNASYHAGRADKRIDR